MITSGIRIGTPAVTTRGFKEAEVVELANWISDLIDSLSSRAHMGSADGKGGVTADPKVIDAVRAKVEAVCARFPVYGARV
jgi:glycine hydroxymethyltransferase